MKVSLVPNLVPEPWGNMTESLWMDVPSSSTNQSELPNFQSGN